MSAEQRIEALGIQLGAGAGPAGNYAKAVQSGRLLFLSGKAAPAVDGQVPKGRLGGEYTAEQGQALARAAAIDLLSTLKSVIGSLDQVSRVVELAGSLCTTEDFEDHAKVLDGASNLLVEIFGPSGLHARSVIGVYSLRGGVPMTLKATFELKDGVQAKT